MTPLDLHAFLRSRRSVRRFRPDPVPPDVLERILETASFAPSAHNRQPWRFVVLSSAQERFHLAQAMADDFGAALQQDGLSGDEIATRLERSRRRITNAPLAIVLCTDFMAADEYPDRERQAADNLMLVQDATLAGGMLLLAAHAEGLGACWVCAPLFTPDAALFALHLPETWEPLALILLGYALETPAPRARKPIQEVTRYFPPAP